MTKTNAKKHKKHTGRYIFIAILLLIAGYMIVQGIRCAAAVKAGRQRMADCGAQTVELSYGKMSYIDRGEGETILSVHGIFGGYDQAYDTCRNFSDDFRILAPSRFGYPGSDIMGGGTPAEQAQAYAELLDRLGIDKVYVLSTSAGGSVAIRFALDYPDRTKGLILYCSGVPKAQKPEKVSSYSGPPAFLCSDYPMFLISPLFKPIMGMEPSTIYEMLPCGERKEGVVLDATVTNGDMGRNYDSYRVEELQVPTLIIQSKDDKLVNFEETEKAVSRFPDCTCVFFEDGGHLMAGHAEEVRSAVLEFAGKQ